MEVTLWYEKREIKEVRARVWLLKIKRELLGECAWSQCLLLHLQTRPAEIAKNQLILRSHGMLCSSLYICMQSFFYYAKERKKVKEFLPTFIHCKHAVSRITVMEKGLRKE